MVQSCVAAIGRFPLWCGDMRLMDPTGRLVFRLVAPSWLRRGLGRGLSVQEYDGFRTRMGVMMRLGGWATCGGDTFSSLDRARDEILLWIFRTHCYFESQGRLDFVISPASGLSRPFLWLIWCHSKYRRCSSREGRWICRTHSKFKIMYLSCGFATWHWLSPCLLK